MRPRPLHDRSDFSWGAGDAPEAPVDNFLFVLYNPIHFQLTSYRLLELLGKTIFLIVSLEFVFESAVKSIHFFL